MELSSDKEYPYYYYENETLRGYLRKLLEKVSIMIKDKREEDFDEIEIQLSGLMHLLVYFDIQIGLLYPLKVTIERLQQTQTDANETVIRSHVTFIDLICKQEFVVLIAFSLETILKLIAEKYKISLNDGSITKKYCRVMQYFDVEIGERDAWLDIFYWTRNTLHNGGKVTMEGHRKYKGNDFDFNVGEIMKHAEWAYFTYFVSDMLDIIQDILKSPKFTKVQNSMNN